ncbi:hypothetical protein HMPREF1869_01555 [Bacteroidales bacterium KA00251]|nr:hypothetical protein HMPREF1869_01555 [Bacteroidales bacterium KA00251]
MKRTVLSTAVVAVFTLLTLASCGKNSKAYKELQSDYDSLNLISQSQIGELDSIVSFIITNFQDINQMEGMIDANSIKGGDIEVSQRTKIEDNIRMIRERLQSNKEEIAKLNQRLRKSKNSAGALQKTISALEKQLSVKTKEILELTEELQRKNIQISQLDSMVTDLNKDVEENKQTISKQEQTIQSQDKEINTVSYCVGTSSDLKEMDILKNGKVSTENYESSYFRKVDKRTLTSIPLYAKRATLLTNHPESSYQLVKGSDNMLTLQITDTNLFWSHSRVLVVKVN